MNPTQLTDDLASSHITPVNGNVFVDLDFSAEEAQALLEQADAGTTRVLAELLESAADRKRSGNSPFSAVE